MDLNELKQDFIAEAETLLSNLDNILMELEKDMENTEFINQTFRVMHTIKGSSGMYGFEKIVSITHELESIYDQVRQGIKKVTPDLVQLTFSVGDHLRALLVDEFCNEQKNAQRHKEILEQIDVVRNKEIKIEKTNVVVVKQPSYRGDVTSWNILFYPNDELVRRCVNLVYTFHDLLILGEYKIHNTPFTSKDDQYWSIFLVTDKGYEEIESALLFVLEYCKITKVADFDIFRPEEFNKRDESVEHFSGQPENIDESEIHESAVLEDEKMETKVAQPTRDKTAHMFQKHGKSRINVDSSKLDTLMYLVSELVTTKSELLLALQKGNEAKALESAEKIDKLSKMFSDNTLSIRLVPLHETIGKFKRLVRDLAKDLQKNITFISSGEDTELDKNIIDLIGEPVMHIIRNCVDHGIETPIVRTEHGKLDTGTIRFDATTIGNSVCITISDDGNGIDPQKILSKAIEKGLVSADATLTNEQILDLIFLPGFSTAENVSNISGRGVGMDIVLKKIKDIRGEVAISSVVGKGTTFTIKLQQTISIINTLLVQADDITYAIPVEDISACILEAHENIIDKQNNLLDFNGNLIPFINMRTKFNPLVTQSTSETEKVVIVSKLNKTYAIITDNIIGEYQAVVKPLGNTFYNVNFLSGASLLGDGSIALLLDTDKLWQEMLT